MGATFDTKPEKKQKGPLPRGQVLEDSPASFTTREETAGAPAGMPLFLQACSAFQSCACTVQRVTEEEIEKEEEEIQPKLAVSRPGDRYEREADQVAQQVMRMPGPGRPDISGDAGVDYIQTQRTFPPLPDAQQEPSWTAPETAPPGQEEAVARTSPGEGGEGAMIEPPEIEPYTPEEDEPPLLQAQPLARKTAPAPAAGSPVKDARPGLQETISRSKGGGAPLSPGVQAEMEHRFGRDFSQVRVHTGGEAVQLNRRLAARAFTTGNDIFFNANEYSPRSPAGMQLLAHELTHTVQQESLGDAAVQRFTAQEQRVAVEPTPAVPNDGAEVTGAMDRKISDDPRVREQDELNEEERREAQNPERGEVRRESSEISSSGESSPSVDRGAVAQQKTDTQKAEVDQAVQEHPTEAPEGEAAPEEGPPAELSEAEAAAQRAEAALQQAQSVQRPDEPETFQQPRIETPVDSAGEPLPRNGQIDTQVRGLGYIGGMLREKGYEMKRHAAEQEIGSYGLQAVLERQGEDLANAREGTSLMEEHTEERQEIAQQSREALAESEERQQFVAEKAPDLAAKADEGQSDSGALAGESRSKADRSQSEIPDDPDARADAQEQSGEMESSAQGAELIDEAITQTGQRARQYQEEAAVAAEQNQQSESQITETEDIISRTEARLEEMNAANDASQAQIDNARPGPELIRQHSQETAQSGDQLIAATVVMEQELNSLQDEYLASMGRIESREDAEQRLQEQASQEAPPPELSPEEQELLELAGMNDEEQEQRIADMDQAQRDRLMATLDRMIQETPDEQAPAGEPVPGAGALSALGLGEEAPDPRAPQIQQVENRRIERVGGVLDVADRNMTFLTQEQQRMLANRLVAQSITDDISNISILQMGKEMIKGMFSPAQMLQGVVSGIEKTLTGLSNIGNWEAWQRDPLGNLLQIASDITTGLAIVFTTILGIAAAITALMVALTILSWGFLSPVTGPVIGWMGTVMTYAGWAAIITGVLAVYFNYLSYIKNLHDAGTAETARDLFANTDQMKQNATDGFQGAMAVVSGIGAAKMGPKLSSGDFFSSVPRSPGQWATQTVQGVQQGVTTLAGAPIALARGAQRLFSGGRRGLVSFRNRIRGFAGRRRDRRAAAAAPETPQARRQHQRDLDEARGQRMRDMDETQVRAEMRALGENRPRRVEPGSEHFRSYDVEVRANGHTYRRRRDGRGWCRFSTGDCGISDDALPAQVTQDLPAIDPAGAAPTTQPPASTGRVSPRQSELDALAQNPGTEAQVSFINGRRVSYGRKGSSRPDGYREVPRREALEVKNYEVTDPANRARMYETIQQQYRQRLGNLPPGTKQIFILDLRGQTVNRALMNRIRRNVLTVTSSSRAEVQFML